MEPEWARNVQETTLTDPFKKEIAMFRGIALWLLGIPIPIIILLAIFLR